jgi:NADP-reducing hydrogenase subunit HndB
MGIQTLEELKKIKESVNQDRQLREGGFRARVNVHMGTCGIAAGAQAVLRTVEEELGKREAKDILLVTSGCAGACNREPMVTVEILGAPPVKYIHVGPEKMREIFQEHVLGGRPIEKYALAKGCEAIF